MWFVLLCIAGSLAASLAETAVPHFRDDYIFKQQTRSFYKLHTANSTWPEARRQCQLEGAELYVPENQKDAEIGVELMKTKRIIQIYIGLQDILAEGDFSTSEGLSTDVVYDNWGVGEPTGEDGEDCVVLKDDALLNDQSCFLLHPFICKKPQAAVVPNPQCVPPNTQPPSKPHFRDDYTYKPETRSFYKYHSESKTWSNAKQNCKVEGAELYVPVNEIDAEIGVKLMKTKGNPWIFVDLSDTLVEGKFVTSQGVSIDDVFNKWNNGEPNNKMGEEDCVILYQHSRLNDDLCSRSYPYICKKTQDSDETTTPPVADPSKPYFRADYVYKPETQSFYKLHSHETWADAKQTCNLEGAKLFVPVNQKDAEIGVALMKTKQFSQIYVDLQDASVEGDFITSEGVSSTDLYDKWSTGEPTGEDGEDCAVLKDNALLNDQSCSLLYPFICKKVKDEVVTYPECTTPVPPTTSTTQKTTVTEPSNPTTVTEPSNLTTVTEPSTPTTVTQQPSTPIVPTPPMPFFRKDYAYKPETRSFYKLHLHTTWSDARQRCKLEGAELYVPVNQTDADIGLELMKTKGYGSLFVDLQDMLNEGEFTSSAGVPVDELFNKWNTGEPNNYNGKEDCVALMKATGALNDVPCSRKLPFICKKTQDSVVWNTECDLPYPGFKYHGLEDSNKCYKFSLSPMTWKEAHAACRSQESYLAVINGNAEANHLVKMTEMATKGVAQEDNPSGEVHLGFHKMFGFGFETLDGGLLGSSGYGKWSHSLPGAANSTEQCGSMSYDGTLNAISCSDSKAYFICEHDVIPTNNGN